MIPPNKSNDALAWRKAVASREGACVEVAVLAEGRGVGLVVSSLIEQLPRGVKLIDLTPPRPMLTVNAVWRQDHELPALDRLFETSNQLADEHQWS